MTHHQSDGTEGVTSTSESKSDLGSPETSPDESATVTSASDATMSVTVPATLAVAAGATGPADATAVVTEVTEAALASLVGDEYESESSRSPAAPTDGIEVTVKLSRPTTAMLTAVVDDAGSPFDSVDEFVVEALHETAGVGSDRQLTVDRETAALLRAVGDGDPTTGAVVLVERLVEERFGAE